ncbi:hypothetical protein MESS4_590056 [Mesorhizobium sp. STM 4661]|nr:hypothetical protein MESS4_590056 [Mesorhizobium sp. STM 4661]
MIGSIGLAAGLPHRLLRPLRPFLVVSLAVDVSAAGDFQDLSGCRQRFRIDVSCRVPQFRSDNGPGALEIHRIDIDNRDRARRLAFDGEGGAKRGVGGDVGLAVDAQRRAGGRHQEQQPDARIANDVFQRIGTVIAAPVRHHQGFRVMDAHEAGKIAARRAVQPFRPAGRQRNERRGLDEGGVFGNDMVEFLDHRRFAGQTIKGFELFDRVDDGQFFVSEPLPALPHIRDVLTTAPVELAVAAQSLLLQFGEIGGPARLLLVAQRMQVAPGEDAGVVEIVESDADGIVADRLDLEDRDVALTGNGHALFGRMALHFGRRRGDTQKLRRQFERLMVGEGHGQQPAVFRDPEFLRRRHGDKSRINGPSLRRFAQREKVASKLPTRSVGGGMLLKIETS